MKGLDSMSKTKIRFNLRRRKFPKKPNYFALKYSDQIWSTDNRDNWTERRLIYHRRISA